MKMKKAFIMLLILSLILNLNSINAFAEGDSDTGTEVVVLAQTDSDKGFACIVSETGEIYWQVGKDSCGDLMKLYSLQDDGSNVGIHIVPVNSESEKYAYLYPDREWTMLVYNVESPSWFTTGMEAAIWSEFYEWKEEVYGILDLEGLLALSSADTLNASPAEGYEVTDENIAAFLEFITAINSLPTYMRNSVTKTITNAVGASVGDDAYNSVSAATNDAKSAGKVGTQLSAFGVSNVGVMQQNFYAAIAGSFFSVEAENWVYYSGAADGYPYEAAMYMWEHGMYPSQDSSGYWRLHAANGGSILYTINDEDITVKNAFAAVVSEDGTVYWKSGLDNVDLIKAYYGLDDSSEYLEVQVKPVLSKEDASFSLPDGNNTSVTRVFPYLDDNATWTITVRNTVTPSWYDDSSYEGVIMNAFDEWYTDVYNGFEFESALADFPIGAPELEALTSEDITDEDIALLAEWAAAWYNITEKGIEPTAAIILSGYERVGSSLWDDFDAFLLSSWRAVHSECPGTVITKGYLRDIYNTTDKSIQNAVADSVSDVMEALAGYYFTNIETWEYYDGDASGYPFAAGAELVLKNLVPFTDGEYWYFSSGNDANIIFTISAVDLLAMGIEDDSTVLTVSYITSDGEGSYDDTDIPYESKYTILELSELFDTNISRDGYTFMGWNTEADGSGDDYAPGYTFYITADLSLYAQWEKDSEPSPDSYMITYDKNGDGTGSYVDTDLEFNANYTVLSLSKAGIEWAGYDFKGWNTQPDGSGASYAEGDEIIIIGDVTLYAQWEAESVIDPDPEVNTVTYYANGGTGSYEDSDLDDESDYTVLSNVETNISRSGCTFKGWNTQPNGTGTTYEIGEIIIISGDLILYAQWEADPDLTYTVTYNANGGEGGDYADKNLVSGNGYMVKEQSATGITRDGYTFKGWNTAADGSGTSYTVGGTITITGDITLYAQWEIITESTPEPDPTYTVNYNANGGEGSYADASLVSGNTYTVKGRSATGITRDGYTFKGWNTAADGSGTSYTSGSTMTITGNVTLYAQWVKNAVKTNNNSTSGKSSVKTDDMSNIGLWITLLCVSLTGAVFITWGIRRRKEYNPKH